MQSDHGKLYVAGAWLEGRGKTLDSISPLDGEKVWAGRSASAEQVSAAVEAARAAQPSWALTELAEREAVLRRFAELAVERKREIADLIHREMGKPLPEAEAEAGAVAGKVQLTIDALRERRSEQTIDMGGKVGRTWYKPLGVVGVLGPFNFPMHLANGHIIPALLSGNTVVFKPSEATPACGEMLVRLLVEAGLPGGCINLLQGDGSVGKAIIEDGIDGLLFTGGSQAGLAIHKRFGNMPERMLALELGGNNPIVVHEPADMEEAANIVAESAFVTAGQRCTCARRLFITGTAEPFIDALKIAAQHYAPAVLARAEAAEDMKAAQDEWIKTGGRALLPARFDEGPTPCYVTPGIIETTGLDLFDTEVFAPLLQLRRVTSLDAAIDEANRTSYGLAAGIVTADDAAWEQFRHRAQAGIINRNTPITGASGKLPFGGIKHSGNGRPSGYFAIDYCSHVVASVEA